MTTYRVIYKVNNVEFFRDIDYSSSSTEAAKMIELAAKWNDRTCDIEIISVECMPENYTKTSSQLQKNRSKLFQYGDSEI